MIETVRLTKPKPKETLRKGSKNKRNSIHLLYSYNMLGIALLNFTLTISFNNWIKFMVKTYELGTIIIPVFRWES